MAQCPICHTEYTENTVNFCSTCGWDLTPDSFPEQVLEAISHKERIRITWARGMWSWASEMRLQLQQATQEQKVIQSQLSQVLEQTSTERLLEIFAAVSPSAKQLIELNAELQQTQYKIFQLKAQLHEAQSQIGTDGLDLLIQAMKADESETVQRVALLLLRRSAAPKAIEALEEFKPDSYKLLSSLPYGAHKDSVKSVAISPDGRTLASGSGDKDKTIKLWDVSSINSQDIQTLFSLSLLVLTVSISSVAVRTKPSEFGVCLLENCSTLCLIHIQLIPSKLVLTVD